VLLVGAGLMIRTLSELHRVALGFDPARVLTLRVTLTGERYREPQARAEFWRRVTAAVEALPSVEAASASRGLPMGDWSGQFFTTAERPDPPAGQVPDANYVAVGPAYFRALRIPIHRGRAFDDHDVPSAPAVAIVNEELARLHWPGENPLGKRLRIGTGTNSAPGPWLTVIGVAGNVMTQGPEYGAHSEIYVPYTQPWLMGPESLLVRAAADPAGLARAVEDAVHGVDAEQPVAAIRSMDEVVRVPMAVRRMVIALLGGFAGLAFLLSALGIYSVLSYAVAQRTREIGLRMALGARRGDLVRLVAGRGARLIGFGLGAGTVFALALSRVMADLLYDVRATDPATFAAVALLLGAASLAACYLPARRACAVEPIVALRRD
jgi:putative ABC transport system permease protein